MLTTLVLCKGPFLASNLLLFSRPLLFLTNISVPSMSASNGVPMRSPGAQGVRFVYREVYAHNNGSLSVSFFSLPTSCSYVPSLLPFDAGPAHGRTFGCSLSFRSLYSSCTQHKCIGTYIVFDPYTLVQLTVFIFFPPSVQACLPSSL